MYVSRLGTSVVAPAPALFTLPGETAFQNWTTLRNNVSVAPSSVIGPGGAAAQTITATGGSAIIATRFPAFAPLLRFNIFVHIGSGSLDANKFDMYNVNTSTILARGEFDYGAGNFLEQNTQLGRCTARAAGNGWYLLSLENGLQTVSPGDPIQIYAGFEGNNEAIGEYASFALASVTDQAAPLPSINAAQQLASVFSGPRRGLKIAIAAGLAYAFLNRR